MRIFRMVAPALAAALLLAGCSKPPEVMLQRLNPEAPAATGLPPSPLGDEPTPLLDRPPFGLYATAPSRDTLTSLSTGTLSPDGRFRAALTEQGLWVVRKDGAWLWQVPVPGADKPAAPQQPGQPGQQPGQAQQPAQPQAGQQAGQQAGKPAAPPPAPRVARYLGPIQWTARSTLLMRDDTGAWVECEPEAARVTTLPAALQGKEGLQLSPDGKQVMYYVAGKKGRELWIARVDGTEAKYLGENVVGSWDPAGKPVVQTVTVPVPTGTSDMAPDLRSGPVRQ